MGLKRGNCRRTKTISIFENDNKRIGILTKQNPSALEKTAIYVDIFPVRI